MISLSGTWWMWPRLPRPGDPEAESCASANQRLDGALPKVTDATVLVLHTAVAPPSNLDKSTKFV